MSDELLGISPEAKNVASIVQSIAEGLPGGAAFNVQINGRVWTITMEHSEEMTRALGRTVAAGGGPVGVDVAGG